MNAIKQIIEKMLRVRLLSLTPFVLLVFSLISTPTVWAACGPATLRDHVFINEYFFDANLFIEVYVDDVARWGDLSGYSVVIYKELDTTTKTSDDPLQIPLSSFVNSVAGGDPHFRYYAPTGSEQSFFSPNSNIVIGTTAYSNKQVQIDNEIDLLRIGKPTIPTYYTTTCSNFSSTTDVYHNIALTGSLNEKNVARIADGGPWYLMPGNGFNTADSQGTSNISALGLLFTATASPSSTTVNSNSLVTLTLTNGSSGTSAIAYSSASVAIALDTGLSQTSGQTSPWSIGNLAAGTSTSTTLNVTSATANTYYVTATLTFQYTGSANATPIVISTRVPITFTAVVVSSFNAFETATAAAAVTGVIRTKIAGSPFALDVVAISAGAQSSGFTNNVRVELLANTGTPGTGYGADNCPTSNAIIQTINSAAIAGGRSTVNFSAIAEAYRDVRVRISYPTTAPTVTSCSSDSFAIRPNSIGVSLTDTDWQSAGTIRTLANTAASGGNVHKAGQPFTLQATALNAVAATTTNYTGTPAAVLSTCGGTACTAAFGAFSPGTGTAVAGVINSATAAYSEVGAFNLQLQDSIFAVIDSADTVADCTSSGYYVCSSVTAAGRFVPDHFATAVMPVGGVPMVCPSGLICPALNAAVPAVTGMVYARQSFSTQITARNAAGATTANYSNTTGLSQAVTLTAWDALGSTATQNPPGGTATLASSSVLASTFSNGVASISTSSYSFVTDPTVPTAIYLRAQDSDNVTSLRTPLSSSLEGGVEVVNGRIKILNAYGSELLPLTLPATVQFYNAAGSWATSSSDTVTSFAAADFALDFPAATANKLAACETVLSVAGSSPNFRIILSAPGAGNSGWTDLTLNLGAAAGNRCTVLGGAGAASTTANRPWLQYPAGTNPAARATFGVYSGNNNLIYQRESY